MYEDYYLKYTRPVVVKEGIFDLNFYVLEDKYLHFPEEMLWLLDRIKEGEALELVSMTTKESGSG